MKIKNHTDITDTTVRRMIEFVRPSGVNGFDVRLSNFNNHGNGWPARGTAYCEGSAYHHNSNPFIVVSVAPRKCFPTSPKPKTDKDGYLPLPWFASREEAALYYIAHEIRHLQQTKTPANKLRDRVWGTRGRYSERDADAYAMRKLRAWRKLDHVPEPVAAPEPAPDPTIAIRVKIDALTKRRKAWMTKLKRAQTALKKIDRLCHKYRR